MIFAKTKKREVKGTLEKEKKMMLLKTRDYRKVNTFFKITKN